MSKDLIKRLRDAASEMLKDVESRLDINTTVWPQFVVNTRKLLIEADAALPSVYQSREDWILEGERLAAELSIAAYNDGSQFQITGRDRPEDNEFDALLAFLRTVPDTPGMALVPVEPKPTSVVQP